MPYSRVIQAPLVPALAILFFLFLSCSAGMVAPGKGVTDLFVQQFGDYRVNLADYDFSRLSQGYGLCIFSYEFSGRRGNRITGFSEQVETGLRVWEHKFAPTEPDLVWPVKRMMVWGYRSAGTFFLTKTGYDIKVRVPYIRGQIIYGGRLIVDFPNKYTRVESHFDEDLSSWLMQHGKSIEGITIDTILILPNP